MHIFFLVTNFPHTQYFGASITFPFILKFYDQITKVSIHLALTLRS